ncbi:unnamed protein product [Phytomonas sp. Hart1]|nr:unnamed protein product [Phytomonas sp. Hart1]|eukprot:CCW71499.1 unnamed protein product [Phytomonas sp. isolate Hart1]
MSRSGQGLFQAHREVLAHHKIHRSHMLARLKTPVYSKTGMYTVWLANALCAATYCIMINWIYKGYVDLWYGVYGIEDDK